MNLKDQIKLIEDAIKALDAVEEVVGGPLVSATRNKLYRRAKARYDEIENMNLEFSADHKANYKGWVVYKNPVSGVVKISRPMDTPIVFEDRPSYCNITHEIRTFSAIGDCLQDAIDWIDIDADECGEHV